LQKIYLPTLSASDNPGWQFSHLAVATNTYQKEIETSEFLIMDVELYRYEFSLGYQWDDWRVTAKTPIISFQSGALDSVIDQFHDLLQLPEGGRRLTANDKINLVYMRNGLVVFSQDFRDSGLGDIAVSLTRHISQQNNITSEISIGVEIPTGNRAVFGGGGGIDYALWLTHIRELNPSVMVYGLFGLSYLDANEFVEQFQTKSVSFSQVGIEYSFTHSIIFILQLDMHSAIIKDSALNAFGSSLQMQGGFKLKSWLKHYDVDFFVAEDIKVGSSPDVAFGMRFVKKH